MEQKIRAKEIQANQEQLDMVKRKDQIKQDSEEVESYLKIYKESFPENPAFASSKKKAEVVPEPVKVVVQEPVAVDVDKIVEDALSIVADSIILGTLHG